MSAADAVRQADALALLAADKLDEAMRVMRRASRILARTEDYKRTVAGRKAGKTMKQSETYAAYRRSSIMSLIWDGELKIVPGLLRREVRSDRTNMGAAIAEDERDRRRFGGRKAA